MTIIQTLLSNKPSIEVPQGWLGWTGWSILALFIVALCWEWREYHQSWRDSPVRRNPAWLLAILMMLAAPAALFLGVNLPPMAWLSPPNMPMESLGSFIMLLAAVPWMLTAGLYGPAYAAGVGLLSGLCLSLWGNHNPFTPLEIALLATLFSAAVRQNYRTRLFRILRSPLLAAILLSIFYPLVYLGITPLTISGSLVNRLDYTMTQIPQATLAMGIGLIISSLFAQGVALAIPRHWGTVRSAADLIPSPAEKSLQARFFYNFLPWAFIIMILLIASDWFVADRAARELLWARMQNNAQVATENIPYFIVTGQSLIKKFAGNPAHYDVPVEQLSYILEDDAFSAPFFSQLMLFGSQGELLAAYPDDSFAARSTSTVEQKAISLAMSGVDTVQFYAIPPIQVTNMPECPLSLQSLLKATQALQP